MKTLLLRPDKWDLVLDANGNIALAAEPYAITQDVASAVRLFAGEAWFDTTQGVPYLTQILGKRPPLALIRARIEAAARTVPLVVKATCVIASVNNRALTGQIQVKDINGGKFTVSM